MNRIKVWLYALLVVAVAAVALREHALRLRARELAGLDARLAVAAAQVASSSRALAREASAAAAFAARDENLQRALASKQAAPSRLLPRKRPRAAVAADEEAQEAALREAARAALTAAERTFGFELPGSTVVTAGNGEWLARKGEPSAAEGETMAALRAAIGGKAERGHARLNGALYYAAASPVPQGAGLVVLVPVDAPWTKAVAEASAADVTLAVPDVKPVSTVADADAQAIAGAAVPAGAAAGVGRLGKVEVALGPVKLPPLASLLGEVPAFRARAVPLEGVEGIVVVSLPAAAALGPVISFEWKAVLALAAVLLAGLVAGLLVRTAEAPAALPAALVAAAARIEKGDFGARAPELAGKLGTLAAALNRAAELAGPVAAAATAGAAVAAEPAAAKAAPAEPAPSPFDASPFQAAPLQAAPFEPAASPFAPGPSPFDAAPSPFDAAPAPRAEPQLASAPALLQAAALAPPAEANEDAQWQQVFQDFLRTRTSCGEAVEGLTFEKFRLKLEGNKAVLVGKYGCRTVKFQVYVKEGKAALKATPVK
jgi:hypothetical protein